MIEICGVFGKSILLYAAGHAVHTVFTFYKLLSQECMKKYALRLSSQVLSCCLCFKRHFFLQSPQEKKKVIWNVFHSMSHTRLQQINKPCCLAAETQRNVTHQSSDDGNGTTGMLNFSGWCVGTAGVALDPFKAFLYVCYQLCVKSLPFFGNSLLKFTSAYRQTPEFCRLSSVCQSSGEEILLSFCPFLCPNRSLGLLHDQLSYSDSDDWATCQGENIHVQEAHALPQLDRSADQRSGTPTEFQGWIEINWQFECFELWSVINVLIDIKRKGNVGLKGVCHLPCSDFFLDSSYMILTHKQKNRFDTFSRWKSC